MTESIFWSKARLQTWTSGMISITFLTSPMIGWGLYFYLLTTRFWCFCILYLLWLYYDRNTPESGGRSVSWLQNSTIWQYFIDYFPSEVTIPPSFSLDSNKNYLFCSFPHGILPLGAFIGVTPGVCKFRNRFPNFLPQMATLNLIFLTPFMRDLGMGIGLVSCSAKSLDYILSRPNGGRIVNLSPGGALEAYYSHPGRYSFCVKNRKGFIRTALRNGATLVPVITFGEVDLFQQVESVRFRFFQEFVRKKLGVVPVAFYGTGFFFSFGWVPRKKKLKTVLGKPINVSKIDNPTEREVDDLHARFVRGLENLFDSYKNKFLGKDKDKCLVIK